MAHTVDAVVRRVAALLVVRARLVVAPCSVVTGRHLAPDPVPAEPAVSTARLHTRAFVPARAPTHAGVAERDSVPHAAGAPLPSHADLRDVISLEKDVEGLNHRYRYALYHNIRHLDDGATKKCVLPCTPLAVVKILEGLGAYDRSKPVGQQLSGTSVVVYNRSEVVGRPLGAMLANDGARVYSVDVSNTLIYTKGRVAGTIRVEETSITQEEALSQSTIVISGVPVKSFSIKAANLRTDALCVNFSQFSNFGEGTEERVAQYVPAIGKVTIAMLERNLVRLHANFHGSATPPANFTTDSWRGKKVEPSTTWKYVATVAVALAAGAGLALAAGRRR